MAPELSSTLWLTSTSVKAFDSCLTKGVNSGLPDNGKTEAFKGARKKEKKGKTLRLGAQSSYIVKYFEGSNAVKTTSMRN